MDELGRLGPFLPTDNGRWEELWDYGPTKDTIMAATGCTLIYKFRQQWGEGKRILVTGPPERLRQAYALGIHLVGGTPPSNVPLLADFGPAPAPAPALAPAPWYPHHGTPTFEGGVPAWMPAPPTTAWA